MREDRPAPASPDVYEALFGELPEGWRERKGLPPRTPLPAAGDGKTDTAQTPPPPRRPGAPETPWQLGRDNWLAIGKRVVAEFGKDRVTSVAGGVTFFGLLALFPAITALVSLYGLIADRQMILDNMNALDQMLPPSAVDLIGQQIRSIVEAPSSALSIAGVIALVLALWSAMGGIKALIEALNVAWFETEKRSFVKVNLVALALTLGAIAVIIILIAVIAVIPVLLQNMGAGGWSEGAISLLRWPLTLGLLLMALAVVYRYGPSKDDAAWHWITPGALFAAVGLIIASMLFSWYAANFANYNKTYGSLGAAVVLMMWLWISSIVVMTGAEINSETERQMKIENGVTPKSDRDLDLN